MKDFIKTSKTIILALVIVFGASYVYAWTGPTQVPTGGNTSTPINISNSAQYKNGALSIGGVFRAYSNAFFDGNVGIGTLSPSAGGEQNLKLDVEGAVGAEFYCDEDGNNCVAGDSIGTGGGGLPNCSEGDFLQYLSGSWNCVSLPSGPASTYSWKTDTWGSCGAPQVMLNNKNVYSGSDGCGQKTTKVKTTSTSKTRGVWCESDTGQSVADSFCSGIKPGVSLACSTTIQYRMWANDMSACGGGAGPVRLYKGLDTNAGSYNWNIRYYDHGWKIRTGSGTKSAGTTQINTGVQTHQGSTGQYLNLTF